MEMPAVMGIDAAGTVTALGADVGGFAVGNRVIAHLPLNGKGAHAELTVACADAGVATPDDARSLAKSPETQRKVPA